MGEYYNFKTLNNLRIRYYFVDENIVISHHSLSFIFVKILFLENFLVTRKLVSGSFLSIKDLLKKMLNVVHRKFQGCVSKSSLCLLFPFSLTCLSFTLTFMSSLSLSFYIPPLIFSFDIKREV